MDKLAIFWRYLCDNSIRAEGYHLCSLFDGLHLAHQLDASRLNACTQWLEVSEGPALALASCLRTGAQLLSVE